MVGLNHPFPVIQKEGTYSFGGNQGWLSKKYMQKSGCGVISCTDVLLYLHRNRAGCRTDVFENDSGEGTVTLEQYEGWTEYIRSRYLPVIPYMGTIGVEVAVALNRYFSKYRIPLKASWGVRKRDLWKRIEAMLANDIPVILSVGANFPLPLKLHKLTFYRDTKFSPACRTCAHFVTVTGIDDDWLHISSWGRSYYLNRQEFFDYVGKHSNFIVSNIVWIWPA